MAKDLPGRGDLHQAGAYAEALHGRFQAAGIRSRVVRFQTTVRIRGEDQTFPRTAVIYEDPTTPAHPSWYMDQSLFKPVWLPEGSLESQLRFATKQRRISVESPGGGKGSAAAGRSSAAGGGGGGLGE